MAPFHSIDGPMPLTKLPPPSVFFFGGGGFVLPKNALPKPTPSKNTHLGTSLNKTATQSLWTAFPFSILGHGSLPAPARGPLRGALHLARHLRAPGGLRGAAGGEGAGPGRRKAGILGVGGFLVWGLGVLVGFWLEFGFGAWRVLVGSVGCWFSFWVVRFGLVFGVWGHSFISLPEFRFADQSLLTHSSDKVPFCSLIRSPFTPKGSPHAHNFGYHSKWLP